MDTNANLPRVIAAVTCDLECSPLGTASRLLSLWGGHTVLRQTITRLRQVQGVGSIALLAPLAQHEAIKKELADIADLTILEHHPRAAALNAQVQAGRAWNLEAWRGGAGQWTVFDEDYHPQSIAAAVRQLAADHVLVIPAHAALLDVHLTQQLLEHHLHKNQEMRLTYTPAAPGISGLVLRGDIALEMGEVGKRGGGMPGHLLGYDPREPTFDTLIRAACMQVDPALSKIPNRFLLDTDRAWHLAQRLEKAGPFDCSATMATAAYQMRPAGADHALGAEGDAFKHPREVEIELTARRLTQPVGGVPATIRQGRSELDAATWQQWWNGQALADDLVVTLGGDGDPLLYPDLLAVLRAMRQAGVRNIHLQTDLLEGQALLAAAVAEGLVDVVGVTFWGDDAATYRHISGVDGYAQVLENLEGLLKLIEPSGRGLPLVIPRLLKVRETIPQMEAFFDRWVLRCGWAVIDGPTDRAGAVPFAGVVEMGPPKRKPCRRIGDRLLIRSHGQAGACDQDIHGKLALGQIPAMTLEQLWRSETLHQLQQQHAGGEWQNIVPCAQCREWFRS